MKAEKKTKIEGTVNGNHYTVREVFVNSGKVFRVLLDAKAIDNQSAKNQLIGALNHFKTQNEN